MNVLPQELVDQICNYLDPVDLKQALTVSRTLQRSAERIFLKEFNLKETNAERFLQLYTGDRVRYLRHVRFMPTLPMVVCGRDGIPLEYCRETPDDLSQKDKIFTCQIGFLFGTLKRLEGQTGYREAAEDLRLTIFPPRRAIDWPCLHRKCICWRVHLLHPETLPPLFWVRDLLVTNDDEVYQGKFDIFARRDHPEPGIDTQVPSKLDLRILADLTSRLPNLECLECTLDFCHWGMTMDHEPTRHYAQEWAGPYRDTRHNFARSMDTITLPSSLRCVYLNFHRVLFFEQGRDQREKLPNLVQPQQYDPFSTSLRLLSYNLERMVLVAMVDDTLFRATDGTIPHWPNLKYLDVMFLPTSPSGAEYFYGPRGEGYDTSPGYKITQAHYEPFERHPRDEYYDMMFHLQTRGIAAQFRVVPIEETLRPLLVSFANAAANMPMLRKAMLWTRLEFDPEEAYSYYEDREAEIQDKYGSQNERSELIWGIAYSKPGENFSLQGMGNKGCAARQLWWLTQEWQPDNSLRSVFQRIGQQEHGNEVIEHWASEDRHKWLSKREFCDAVLDQRSLK